MSLITRNAEEYREQVLYFGHSGEALLPVSTDLISIGSH